MAQQNKYRDLDKNVYDLGRTNIIEITPTNCTMTYTTISTFSLWMLSFHGINESDKVTENSKGKTYVLHDVSIGSIEAQGDLSTEPDGLNIIITGFQTYPNLNTNFYAFGLMNIRISSNSKITYGTTIMGGNFNDGLISPVSIFNLHKIIAEPADSLFLDMALTVF